MTTEPNRIAPHVFPSSRLIFRIERMFYELDRSFDGLRRLETISNRPRATIRPHAASVLGCLSAARSACDDEFVRKSPIYTPILTPPPRGAENQSRSAERELVHHKVVENVCPQRRGCRDTFF